MTATLPPLLEERLTATLGRAPRLAQDHLAIAVERHAELEQVLRVAREQQAPVGVGRGVVRLELRALRGIDVDTTSLLVRAGAGWTLAELEAELHARGLQLPVPASSGERTLGGWLAAPRGSEATPRHGPPAQLVYALEALLPDGSELQVRGAPRKAAGPELWQLLVGSRGALAIFTSVTLRVERRAEARREAAWTFPTLAAATATARTILLDGVRPLDLAIAGGPQLFVTFEGPTTLCEAAQRHAGELAKRGGGTQIPHTPLQRYRTGPSERRVPLEAVHKLTSLPRDGRLIGWHLGGATLQDPATPYAPPPPSPMLLALKQRLDPNNYLVSM